MYAAKTIYSSIFFVSYIVLICYDAVGFVQLDYYNRLFFVNCLLLSNLTSLKFIALLLFFLYLFLFIAIFYSFFFFHLNSTRSLIFLFRWM